MRAGIANSGILFKGDFRLDGSYHASGANKTTQLLEERRRLFRRLDTLGSVANLFNGPRFPRIYVDDPQRGVPFLSSSDMLLADLSSVKHLSKERSPATLLEKIKIQFGWTLISCSGTIGNTVYVRQDMAHLTGSQHIMRAAPKKETILPGYLYAFLSSKIGYSLLTQGTYGAVIQHIEPQHIENIPIPRLDPSQEEEIHQLIEQAAELRVEANRFKQIAQNSVEKLLNVRLDASQARNQITSIPVVALNDRLEANYHVSQKSASTFSQSSFPLVPIGELLERIFYLGKLHRVFVDDAISGIPLLSISDVQKAKLSSDKYISKTLSRNIDDAMLSRGWVLISRVGTPGLAIYTRREMEGFAGTDHLVRLVPNTKKILPGFLFSVLSSPVGHHLLMGSEHGSVQLVLPPEYIEQIKIPLPQIGLQQEINDLIERYGESLTLASELEDQAQAKLSKALVFEKIRG